MWDVLPAADVFTQQLGCVVNSSEWPAPWCASKRFHSGVDLGSSRGGWAIYRSPVYATRSGVVDRVGFPNGLGSQAVFVHCDEGGWLIYGHLDAAMVLPGQRVEPGSLLGQLGTRGNSTAPHFHLEYRLDGPLQNVDRNAGAVGNPLPFLYARLVNPKLPAGWHAEDLGGPLAAGAGMTSYLTPDGGHHIYVPGGDGHLWHFWYHAP